MYMKINTLSESLYFQHNFSFLFLQQLFSHNNLILSGTFKANSNVNQTIIPYGVKITTIS